MTHETQGFRVNLLEQFLSHNFAVYKKAFEPAQEDTRVRSWSGVFGWAWHDEKSAQTGWRYLKDHQKEGVEWLVTLWNTAVLEDQKRLGAILAKRRHQLPSNCILERLLSAEKAMSPVFVLSVLVPAHWLYRSSSKPKENRVTSQHGRRSQEGRH